jgi:hypothetical protein
MTAAGDEGMRILLVEDEPGAARMLAIRSIGSAIFVAKPFAAFLFP